MEKSYCLECNKELKGASLNRLHNANDLITKGFKVEESNYCVCDNCLLKRENDEFDALWDYYMVKTEEHNELLKGIIK